MQSLGPSRFKVGEEVWFYNPFRPESAVWLDTIMRIEYENDTYIYFGKPGNTEWAKYGVLDCHTYPTYEEAVDDNLAIVTMTEEARMADAERWRQRLKIAVGEETAREIIGGWIHDGYSSR